MNRPKTQSDRGNGIIFEVDTFIVLELGKTDDGEYYVESRHEEKILMTTMESPCELTNVARDDHWELFLSQLENLRQSMEERFDQIETSIAFLSSRMNSLECLIHDTKKN